MRDHVLHVIAPGTWRIRCLAGGCDRCDAILAAANVFMSGARVVVGEYPCATMSDGNFEIGRAR